MSSITATLPSSINYKFETNVLDYVKTEIFDYKNFVSPVQFLNTAVKNYIRDREIREVLEASESIRRGEGLVGNLDELAKLV